MSGRFFVDTNIAIAFLEGESAVRQKFAEAREIFVSSTVLGELYYGAYRSARTEANLTRIEDFMNSVAILTCDAETAKYYGQIKDSLRKKDDPSQKMIFGSRRSLYNII